MINYFFIFFVELNRTAKQLIQISTDISIIILCFYLAFTIRLLELSNLHDAYLTILEEDSWKVLGIVIFITITTSGLLGIYRTVIRFAGDHILILIAIISIISVVTMYISANQLDIFMPRSVPLIFGLFINLFFIIVRFCAKGLVLANNPKKSKHPKI